MEEPVNVLLYGDTLVLAALQASLAAYDGLRVTCLREPVASADISCSVRPDVVIFDVAAAQSALHYVLAEALPDLLLVAIDIAGNRVRIWTEQQFHELTTDKLVEAIGTHMALSPSSKHGEGCHPSAKD